MASCSQRIREAFLVNMRRKTNSEKANSKVGLILNLEMNQGSKFRVRIVDRVETKSFY